MRKLILGMVLCVAMAPAFSVTTFCGGKIRTVLTYSDGTVMILPDFHNDWLAVCNLNSDWKGVSPVTCVSWFASATRAVANQATVGMYYADVPSCAAVPTYRSAPAPVYLMSY
jgi:hypothetical protein